MCMQIKHVHLTTAHFGACIVPWMQEYSVKVMASMNGRTSSSVSPCKPDDHQRCSLRTTRHPRRCNVFKAPKNRQYINRRSNVLEVSGSSESAIGEDSAATAFQIPPKLNATPMRREARQFFYKDATDAMLATLRAGKSRIRVKCTVPELNTETDVYRVGTLLEMVRDMATALAQDGKRVRVCVQGAMGAGVFQGLPLSLSGVKRIMEAMDWGDAEDFVTIGAVGANQVDDSDYYIMVAPQNVVGNTIVTSLGEHVDAAEAQGKQVVLVNAVLKDLPSHSGIMGVRGRAERMAFADSFEEAYHFRLLYLSGSWYPIMGALRYAFGGQWEVYKRADLPGKLEEYQLLGTFDREPNGGEITKCFQSKPKQADPNRWW